MPVLQRKKEYYLTGNGSDNVPVQVIEAAMAVSIMSTRKNLPEKALIQYKFNRPPIQMNGGTILAVSASGFVMPQTSEHIILSRQNGMTKMYDFSWNSIKNDEPRRRVKTRGLAGYRSVKYGLYAGLIPLNTKFWVGLKLPQRLPSVASSWVLNPLANKLYRIYFFPRLPLKKYLNRSVRNG